MEPLKFETFGEVLRRRTSVRQIVSKTQWAYGKHGPACLVNALLAQQGRPIRVHLGKTIAEDATGYAAGYTAGRRASRNVSENIAETVWWYRYVELIGRKSSASSGRLHQSFRI